MISAARRTFKSKTHDAIDFLRSVQFNIGCAFRSRFAFGLVFAKINSARKFANNFQVHVSHAFSAQWRNIKQRWSNMNRPNVCKKSQLLPQFEKPRSEEHTSELQS